MTVSVVIPTYNHYELIHQSLWDLYKKTSGIDEVLVVNDASTDDTFYIGLSWWKDQKLLPIKELRLKENVGFLRASNKGVAKASGDVIVLLSNDVRVYRDFIQEVVDILHENDKHLIGGRLLDWDTGWNVFNGKLYQYIEGWLLACTKDAWNRFGGFDERFVPNDYEDVDLSTTALDLGYSLVELSNGCVEHIGAQSIGYNVEREKITNSNKEKFAKKWIK